MNEDLTALEDAKKAGIDLDLIDSNLALSVEERWRQHAGALELVLELEKARSDRDARLQPTAHARPSASASSIVRGQSDLSSRESERSASSLPPVWQRGQ